MENELPLLVLNPPPNITKVVDNESFEKLIDFLERTFEFGFDIETTPLKDFYWRRIRTLQFGNAQEQYVIDLKAICLSDSNLLYECQGNYGKNLNTCVNLYLLLDRLSKYLCSDKWIKVGVNLSFEYEMLYWCFGLRTYGYYDCMWTEKVIYAGLGGQAYLKNYEYYSMEAMFGRYFGKSIDKSLQSSLNLEDDLSDSQWEYSALDTRTPLSIKAVQNLIILGETPASLKAKGKNILAGYLSRLDQSILGDNLTEVVDIENGCLGAFVDMHLHGERINIEKWSARVENNKQELTEIIKKLDDFFLPYVGAKNEVITEEEVTNLEQQWKSIRDTPSSEELDIKLKIILKKKDLKKEPENSDIRLQLAELEIKLSQLEQSRKDYKEQIKKKHSELRKKRTAIINFSSECEGEALINYSSNAQLKNFLKEHFKKLAKIESLDDEVLEKYEDIPVVKLIREYHKVSKQITTYGESWIKVWKTGPNNEEGWLHPGDGRLHPVYNQLEAETGRSSSEKPNGQNRPRDKELRSYFIADPPNEDIRLCFKCNSTPKTVQSIGKVQDYLYYCENCGQTITYAETCAEEYVIITADQSGAELRIIAEDSGDELWIGAFEKDQDVHSVGTELLYEEEWAKEALPDCAYFAKNSTGEFLKQKCKCPLHDERRTENKSTNFLLAYGGGPQKLSVEIGKTLAVAKALMALHEKKNPKIWTYLRESGKKAQRDFKAFDLFGRRRLLPQPTDEEVRQNAKEWNEKELRLDEATCQLNLATFEQIKKRKPNKEEEFELTHREPTANEKSRSYFGLMGGINRQGKNHRIQGTNVTISKLAMSALYDSDGKPYLWHVFPKYRAKFLAFIHDEFMVQCPKQNAEEVAALIGDAFMRAAKTHMHKVVMKFDYKIKPYWCK